MISIKKLAQMSKLFVSKNEESYFNKQFVDTFQIIDEFNDLNTSTTKPTFNVTNTKNVYRNDTVDVSRMFSQEDSLKNAKRTYNGLFVIDSVYKR